jgi:hypothetical protein
LSRLFGTDLANLAHNNLLAMFVVRLNINVRTFINPKKNFNFLKVIVALLIGLESMKILTFSKTEAVDLLSALVLIDRLLPAQRVPAQQLQAQQLLSAQHADGNVLKIRSVRMLAR